MYDLKQRGPLNALKWDSHPLMASTACASRPRATARSSRATTVRVFLYVRPAPCGHWLRIVGDSTHVWARGRQRVKSRYWDLGYSTALGPDSGSCKARGHVARCRRVEYEKS